MSYVAGALAAHPRPVRIVLLSATGVLLVAAAWEAAWLWGYVDGQRAIGTDLAYYVGVAERWLQTGEFYLPHQLAGPYAVRADVDNLYPPIALVLFVPFVWVPYPLWWIGPALVGGVLLWRLRPAMWTWPLIAFLVAWPRGISNVIYGNSDMWVFAFIAGGILVGWPAVLVVIKPSVGFFSLLGIRRRSWWIAACVLAALSIPLFDLWLQYPVVLRNSDVHWWYSVEDMPPLFIPLVAWLGSRQAAGRSSWLRALSGPRGSASSTVAHGGVDGRAV